VAETIASTHVTDPRLVDMSGLGKYRDGEPAKGGRRSQYINLARRSLTLLMRPTPLPLCQTKLYLIKYLIQ